jgi:septum formation protein
LHEDSCFEHPNKPAIDFAMTLIQPMPLVLASSSVPRAQMLKACGLHFSVVPSHVNEEATKKAMADEPNKALLAQALAREKALSVAVHYPDHLTIGADQLCVQDGRIYDKPLSMDAAIAQLQQLQGRAHQQMSAVCLARGDAVVWEAVECVELQMRPLSLADIEAYLEADKPLQSCGSYRYEGLGKHLFATVKGQDATIMGMPLQPLLAQLHAMGAVAFEAPRKSV